MESKSLMAEVFRAKRKATLAHQQYMSTLREYFPNSKLYMREMEFIRAVSFDTPTAISNIAKSLNITQGAVSQIASRLEEKGFIQRFSAKEDKRQVLVSLTENGQTLQKAHIEYDKKSYDAIRKTLKDFSDKDLEKIIEYEKICYELFSTNK